MQSSTLMGSCAEDSRVVVLPSVLVPTSFPPEKTGICEKAFLVMPLTHPLGLVPS